MPHICSVEYERVLIEFMKSTVLGFVNKYINRSGPMKMSSGIGIDFQYINVVK